MGEVNLFAKGNNNNGYNNQSIQEQILAELKLINKNIDAAKDVYRIGEEQGWKFEEAQKSLIFTRRVTLNTTPNTFSINLPYPFVLARTELTFSTTNAKTISFRQFSTDYPNSYIELFSDPAETGNNIQFNLDAGYRCKGYTTLSFVFSAFTDGEVVDILIYIEKVL